MQTKFTKPADKAHQEAVQSQFIYAIWLSPCGVAGRSAQFEVRTSLVGEGAPVEIVVKTEKGKKVGKISDVIIRNKLVGEFEVPDTLQWGDRIFFEAKLTKHGLQMESNHIPVRPRIQVKKLAWDRKEARRGDVVTMTADFKSVPDDVEAAVIIYEYDQDGHHDPITSFHTVVKNNKVELTWEYEYHEDTDEIPTQEERQKYGKNYNHPEYFFVVEIDGERMGEKQESGLLRFKDWIELELVNPNGVPVANASYIVHFADGSERKGILDNEGCAMMSDVRPGRVKVEYADVLSGSAVEGSSPQDQDPSQDEGEEGDVEFDDYGSFDGRS